MAELAPRRAALARGVRLEALTVGWMAIEAAVTIGAGIKAARDENRMGEAWNVSAALTGLPRRRRLQPSEQVTRPVDGQAQRGIPLDPPSSGAARLGAKSAVSSIAASRRSPTRRQPP
jgi:hypothetical protein